MKSSSDDDASQPADAPRIGMEVALSGLRSRGVRPEVIFDVGASDGGWTQFALGVWPAARVHCFEPLEARRQALAAFAQTHAGRITYHDVGLADADGELPLGVTDALWDSSFAYRGASAQMAKVRTLDSLLAEGAIPKPNFVKIDVQGFEHRVIEGGRKTLERCDFILMECAFYRFCAEMSRLDQTIMFMSEAGFAPYEFVDFLRRPLDGAMGQCDMLFIRHDHVFLRDARWISTQPQPRL